MPISKFNICSRALVRVGGRPITSFDGTGAEQVTASELYEPAVINLLSKYRWRFSSMQAQLTRQAAPPDMRWDARYLIPPSAENIHAVLINDRPIDFDRYENFIFCNALVSDVVVMDYTYRSSEAYWPGYFQTLLEMRLAADFAIPVAEDATKAQYYEGRFIREFAVAKAADAQGRTARKLPVGGMAAYAGGTP